MIWAEIIRSTLVDPWEVPYGVKMTSVAYIAFLKEHFDWWLKKQKLMFRITIDFMQDNAPSHTSKITKKYLQPLGISGAQKM